MSVPESFDVLLHARQIDVFDAIPTSVCSGHYYRPLSSNFRAFDALTSEAAFQYTVTTNHPIQGVRMARQIAQLYPDNVLPLVYIVPESIAHDFKKQSILKDNGGEPTGPLPRIRQFVASLPIGVRKSVLSKHIVEQ